MRDIGWAGHEAPEAGGLSGSLLICSQLWPRSMGIKHSGSQARAFFSFFSCRSLLIFCELE